MLASCWLGVEVATSYIKNFYTSKQYVKEIRFICYVWVMEKLQELLKEYQLSKWEWVRLAWPDVEVNDKEELVLEATLISKKYWFIKWLVENEKIDLYKLPIRLEEYYQSTEAVGYITDDETILLMELAIQDEPIEFLVSILE